MFHIPSLKKAQSVASFLKDYSKMLKNCFGPQKAKEWSESVGIRSRMNFKNYTTNKRKLPDHVKAGLAQSMDMAQTDLMILEEQIAKESLEPEKYYISEEFFACPINTIILNLCGIRAKMDETKLENILKGLFTPEQINICIESLLLNKLIERHDDSSLVRIFEGRIVTLPGQKSDYSRQYFKNTYSMADLAWQFPLSIREMGAFTFRIDSENIPKMKDLIRNFRNDLCSLGSAEKKSDSVYQCAITTFPIYLEEKDSTSKQL